MTARTKIVIAVATLGTAVLATLALWATPGRAAAAPPRPLVRKVHVRVWEPGAVAPSVSVNIPVALVTATVKTASLFGILDHSIEEARREDAGGGAADEPEPFRIRGRDIVRIWDAIASSGPADLVSVEDADGGRVVVRID